MKYLSLLVLLSFFACKTTEITVKKPVKMKLNKVEKDYQVLEKTELLPNQEIKVVNDEWGRKFIKILPGKHTVLKYSYNKTPLDKTLMDAGYNQIVWFELGNKIKNKTYTTADLQKNPVYVQISGFRNSRLIPVTKAKVETKILSEDKMQILINIDKQYSNILKKDLQQTLRIKE